MCVEKSLTQGICSSLRYPGSKEPLAAPLCQNSEVKLRKGTSTHWLVLRIPSWAINESKHKGTSQLAVSYRAMIDSS